MAWTTKGDRFPVKGEENQEASAPLAYLGPATYKAEPSPAPFGSTAPRGQTDVGSKGGAPKESGPPPGAYDPKLPGAYDSGLPRKQVPFACGAARSSMGVGDSQMPGPGDYYSYKAAQKSGYGTMGLPQMGKRTMFRSSSAPSIPHGGQCYGYEEAGDGRLIRQGPKDGQLHLSGVAGDTAGPGHYESPSISRSLPAGGKWGKGPAREPLAKAVEAPGPGHYAPADPLAIGIEAAGLSGWSASFASTSDQRPSLHKGSVRAAANGGKRRRRKDDTPGPGYYSCDMQRQPALREVHPELQYFGSTSERFQDQAARASEIPGPGTYVARQRVVLKSDWGGTDRFGDREKASAAPGPGSYNPAAPLSAALANSASLLGSTGRLAFGSMESRRGPADPKAGQAPGPGEYAPPSDFVAAPPEQQRRVRVPAPAADEGKRRAPVERPQPAPGAYDPVHSRDVAAVMRLPARGEGFLSSSSRSAPSLGSSQGPDPGAYRVVPGGVSGGKKLGTFNRSLIEGTPQCGRSKNLGFETTAGRFGSGASKSASMPGPGAYKVDQNWTKKNFNIHFGDV